MQVTSAIRETLVTGGKTVRDCFGRHQQAGRRKAYQPLVDGLRYLLCIVAFWFLLPVRDAVEWHRDVGIE